MLLRKWDDLPEFMRCGEVREYYDVLDKKKPGLFAKRMFDVCAAAVLLVIFAIPMLVIAIGIKKDSEGPVFYRQERITRYGRTFMIHKFRTMVDGADKIGAAVTVNKDTRVTRMGEKLRSRRFDEFPQLIDVLQGNMSFVGTRPESPKYVARYTNEMIATLLLPAGITSEASIRYKDEAELLEAADDADKVYINKVLPEKMKINLESLKGFSIGGELKTILRTVGVAKG